LRVGPYEALVPPPPPRGQSHLPWPTESYVLVRRPLSLRTLFVLGVWTRPGARTVWGDGRVPFGEEFPSAKYLYFLIRKVRTHAGGVIESVRPFLLLAAGGGKTGVFPRWCSIGERDGFSDSSEKQMPWAPHATAFAWLWASGPRRLVRWRALLLRFAFFPLDPSAGMTVPGRGHVKKQSRDKSW
jgi:hypothetical protein